VAGVRWPARPSRPMACLDGTSVTRDELPPLGPLGEAACHARLAAGRREGPPRTARRVPVDTWPCRPQPRGDYRRRPPWPRPPARHGQRDGAGRPEAAGGPSAAAAAGGAAQAGGPGGREGEAQGPHGHTGPPGPCLAHAARAARDLGQPRPCQAAGRGPPVSLTGGEAVVAGSGGPGVDPSPRGDPHADQATPRPGADACAGLGSPGPTPPPAPERAGPPPCAALPDRPRPASAVAGGWPRCRPGTGLGGGPAPCPGAPHTLATDG
jgi:hypothetical protein